jgi:hypothetical protein
MLPWGHAAVGYLCYTLYARLRHQRRPLGVTGIALAIGTQFPDLIDKPLAWTFGILPSGRSLGHSLLVLGVVVAGLYWLHTRRTVESPTVLIAFTIGWLSHVFADGYTILLGKPTCLNYMVWPLLGTCPYTESNRSIIQFFLTLEVGRSFWIGLVLTGVALVVWLYDGAPGLWYLRDRIAKLLT